MLKVCLFFGIILISSVYAFDTSKLCIEKSYGELVANPNNCETYYICANKPILQHCSSGLHFDEIRKTCNWPHQSNCRYESSTPSKITTTSSPTIIPTQEVTFTTESSKKLPNFDSSKTNSFGAFSVATSKKIDPLSGFNDQNIKCIHYGVYFLPHPKKCDKYFICAFGHLYMHECGDGIRWNYLESKCSTSLNAKCYVGRNDSGVYHTLSVFLPTAVFPGVVFMNETITPKSNEGNFESEATTLVKTIEISTIPNDSTSHSPSNYNKPKCPRDLAINSYISFPYDCRKYYICIFGMPVLTACANDLYWDENQQSCVSFKPITCY